LLVDNTSFKAEPSLVNLAKNCLNRYEADYINRWIFVNHKDCEPASGSDTHLLYDTAVMAPYFIHNILHPVHAGIAKRFTSLYDSAELGLFMGGSGICTANGLRKPLYHAYTFLSRLGDIVLSEGNNHIITRQGDNIQILLYNLPELARNHPIWDIIVESNKRYADFAQDDVINFHININNLSGDDYIIEQCKLDRENGSIFDKFVQQEAVKYLSAKETAQVNNACFPQIKISLASSCKKWSIRSCLVPNTVEFIKIIHCDK